MKDKDIKSELIRLNLIQDEYVLRYINLLEDEIQLLNTRIERLTIRNEHLESALNEKITLNFN